MSERPSLTDRQQKIYQFVRDKILNRGYGPTVREIGQEFDIRSPNGVMCHLRALERKGLISRVERISRSIQLTDGAHLHRSSLMMEGQVAAGTALTPSSNPDRVDFGDLFNLDDNFCLKIKGDFLADDCLFAGEYLVLKRQKSARNGDIIVAVVNGSDTVVKRYSKERDRVRLDSLGKSAKPVYPSELQILGVVKGSIRYF